LPPLLSQRENAPMSRLFLQTLQDRLGCDRHMSYARSDRVLDRIGHRRPDHRGSRLAHASGMMPDSISSTLRGRPPDKYVLLSQGGFGLNCFDAESSFAGTTSGITGNGGGHQPKLHRFLSGAYRAVLFW
jgi:hypothetical protein